MVHTMITILIIYTRYNQAETQKWGSILDRNGNGNVFSNTYLYGLPAKASGYQQKPRCKRTLAIPPMEDSFLCDDGRDPSLVQVIKHTIYILLSLLKKSLPWVVLHPTSLMIQRLSRRLGFLRLLRCIGHQKTYLKAVVMPEYDVSIYP